ncbi:putative nicotinamide/nicotinate riboside kinase [Paratrimastix pyriformis]|uniref:Nicotinamide/nicotinate riboside kinase n=1 Tax=Paratrimastix pyriformis TaxID=342808 RepID=A0ABQ8UPG2_9EUKA|nr:putative nicotinamide/nicotinate riboside kinase [Paratrimastix pyriformis]
MPTRVVVIGIDGATRSGKSTLACLLGHLLPATVIRGDRFWVPRKPIVHSRRNPGDCFQNWEVPEAVDWESFHLAFLQAVKDLEHSPGTDIVYLVVESFLLFESAIFRQACQKKIVLAIPRAVCHDRRMSTTRVSPDYFDEVLWPSYLLHASKVKKLVDADPTSYLVLDGKDPIHSLIQLGYTWTTSQPLSPTQLSSIPASLLPAASVVHPSAELLPPGGESDLADYQERVRRAWETYQQDTGPAMPALPEPADGDGVRTTSVAAAPSAAAYRAGQR